MESNKSEIIAEETFPPENVTENTRLPDLDDAIDVKTPDIRNIFIATITTDGKTEIEYSISMLNTIKYFAQKGTQIVWYLVSTAPDNYNVHRDKAFNVFLQKTDCSHIFFISPHYSWNPEVMEKMIQYGKEMVVCPVPLDSYQWNNMSAMTGKTIDPANIRPMVTGYDMIIDSNLLGENKKIEDDLIEVKYSAMDFCAIERKSAEYLSSSCNNRKYIFPDQSENMELVSLFGSQYVNVSGKDKKTFRKIITGDQTFLFLWKMLKLPAYAYISAEVTKVSPERRQNNLAQLFQKNSGQTEEKKQ